MCSSRDTRAGHPDAECKSNPEDSSRGPEIRTFEYQAEAAVPRVRMMIRFCS